MADPVDNSEEIEEEEQEQEEQEQEQEEQKEEQQQQEEEAPNVLSLSDDDILNAPPPTEEESNEETPEDTKDKETEEEAEKDEQDKKDKPVKAPESSQKKEKNINKAAEYDKLMAPFNANGKQMQVTNAEEAMSLMKMGANYQKKMTGLKPHLKIVKMLQNNELLDEGKLNYLIDLSKKDPKAINKLIKESKIEPLDIDVEEADNYKPKSYTVSDSEVELEEVLDEIRSSKTYSKTINVVSSKWDEASRQVIVANPTIIKNINSHVESGIYDQISNMVERERTLGRLSGLSDLDAYKSVGDAMQAQGAFDNVPQANASTKKKTDSTKLKNKKKAASSTKSTGRKVATKYDPLAMSDDDFAKITSGNY